MLKRILPKSLLGRSLLIIVMPLVLLQVISAAIFYESHWDRITQRLARSVAGDVAALISLRRSVADMEDRDAIIQDAAQHMQFDTFFSQDRILPNTSPSPIGRSLMERMLIEGMNEFVARPFQIDTEALDELVIIEVQLADGVFTVVTNEKRLFSSTVYVFILWMVGSSMILFGVATIFMRNQVRPIRKLAAAANAFGKGRDAATFKPEGADEVRQAASAFIAMRDRIRRQIDQRTEMLAGVSHDLRTPLTRMRLQLAMMEDEDAVRELSEDVSDMERMLEGYLAFARGEGAEIPKPVNLSQLLEDVAAQARRQGGVIDLHCEGEIWMPLRFNAFKRGLTNLLENSVRYADHISLRAGKRSDAIEVIIDDDGPGIPEDKRKDAFKPFYRLDSSRNRETGGVGLGLSIARDVVHGHGGTILLEDAPIGGLRVRIVLPL